MPNKKKLSGKQEQKDLMPQQQNHQQQKTQQMHTPGKAPKQQVFHDQERIETRMTD
jgi:hypothetical protein